jgi:hypothetical protein
MALRALVPNVGVPALDRSTEVEVLHHLSKYRFTASVRLLTCNFL